LFIYPESQNPIPVFDFDDLEDNFCILCKEFKTFTRIFIWRGFNEDDINKEMVNGFLDDIIRNFYSNMGGDKIFIHNEVPSHESEEFLDCFQY